MQLFLSCELFGLRGRDLCLQRMIGFDCTRSFGKHGRSNDGKYFHVLREIVAVVLEAHLDHCGEFMPV
jgi:hypothetical protein